MSLSPAVALAVASISSLKPTGDRHAAKRAKSAIGRQTAPYRPPTGVSSTIVQWPELTRNLPIATLTPLWSSEKPEDCLQFL
jgi:hypothetical protein